MTTSGYKEVRKTRSTVLMETEIIQSMVSKEERRLPQAHHTQRVDKNIKQKS